MPIWSRLSSLRILNKLLTQPYKRGYLSAVNHYALIIQLIAQNKVVVVSLNYDLNGACIDGDANKPAAIQNRI